MALRKKVQRRKVQGKKVQRQVGRPKTGRNTWQISVSLPMRQIDFLHSFPNASAQLSKLLDSIMQAHEDFEAKFPVLVLKHQIDLFEKEAKDAQKEYWQYFIDHREQVWQDGYQEKPLLPTDEAQYHFKILSALKEREDALKAKVQQLKSQVIS